ncbi:tryptophan-rich sensory protein [Nakamurella panacisegetis]|uniref:tryptophan-rich sensory protein n=1 Tax=Nakamurella panacisegetis TaxID=1090615 RepID=UPI0018D4887D|nr:tryptophan-rich sensory protein [Nakamurella panacisegetis]
MNVRTLATIGAAVTAAAVTGGLATDPGSAYYIGLRKPAWQPPAPAFGLVWTPLYADIAVTTARPSRPWSGGVIWPESVPWSRLSQ